MKQVFTGNYIVNVKVNPIGKQPIKANDEFPLQKSNYLFQNVGNTAWGFSFGSGQWTVLPGSTFEIGGDSDFTFVEGTLKLTILENITVENAAYDYPIIEWMELKTTICHCEPCQNYVK